MVFSDGLQWLLSDADPVYVQVLCPMKKGEVGTHNLNSMLQRALNPKNPSIRYGPNTITDRHPHSASAFLSSITWISMPIIIVSRHPLLVVC
jgi:ATP-dependent exoDNAse (exonuclease V) alpha subunit